MVEPSTPRADVDYDLMIVGGNAGGLSVANDEGPETVEFPGLLSGGGGGI